MTRFALPALTIAVAIAAGCADKKNMAANNSVTDIGPTPTAAATYPPTAAPAPVMAQPVSYDASPAPAQAANSGGTYTVKKGDTLFGIAKSKYGNGNQWKKIAAANPGLSPQTLKVGQTITLP